jgi:dipeptidyl aminopeptidase/acylaminoacyl peptidase
VRFSALLATAAFSLMLVPSAASAAPPVEVYGALPAIQGVDLSPSGKLAAISLNKGEQKVLVVRQLEGDKKIIYSTTLTDRNGGAQWADDNHLFVYGHRTENTGTAYVYEQGFIFLVNLKTGRSQQIAPVDSSSTGSGGREDNPVDDISGIERVSTKDGHSYGFFQEGRKLYRADLDSLQITPVARMGEDQAASVLSSDGEVIVRTEYKDHGRKQALLKGEADTTVLARGEDDLSRTEALGFGRSPDTILYGLNENGTLSNLREINLKDGKVSEDLVNGVEASPIHHPQTHLLIGFYLDGFIEDSYFLDPALQNKWESVKAAFPGKKVSLESTDYSMQRWVVKTAGTGDSGHFYMIDLAEHKAIPLGAQYPDIKDADVGMVSWFDYKTADGTPEKAIVTLPPGYTMETAKNLPAVVLPHGGPQGRDYFGFDWWSQALAARGYVVIQPQFRGSGGYGQAFERAGWGQWGKLMQTDVSDAFKAVAAKGIVDPNRACIVGWSYGGYSTLAGVTVQNGLYRCAAAGAAPADLNAMLVWTRDRGGKLSYGMRYWKKSMGLNGESDPAANAISPAKLVNRITVPVMIIHGRQDTTVPLEQGEIMVNAMRSAGKPVEFVVLENETHHIESASTRTKMLQAMTGFLARYNPTDRNAADKDNKVAASSTTTR